MIPGRLATYRMRHSVDTEGFGQESAQCDDTPLPSR